MLENDSTETKVKNKERKKETTTAKPEQINTVKDYIENISVKAVFYQRNILKYSIPMMHLCECSTLATPLYTLNRSFQPFQKV